MPASSVPFHLHLSSSSSSSRRRRRRPPAVVGHLPLLLLLLPLSSATPHHILPLMAAPPPPPAPAAAGPHSVFVYGTLMAEEVVRVLLGRAPPSSPALLPGHRRFSLRGRVYPAILPARGHAVTGKVFKGLTDRELHVFDLFEDEEYVKKSVEVSLTDTLERSLAYVYIWGNEGDPDLYGEWDYEEWRKVHLKDYLEMTREFMDEIGQL